MKKDPLQDQFFFEYNSDFDKFFEKNYSIETEKNIRINCKEENFEEFYYIHKVRISL
jgi:hypothetical protein